MKSLEKKEERAWKGGNNVNILIGPRSASSGYKERQGGAERRVMEGKP